MKTLVRYSFVFFLLLTTLSTFGQYVQVGSKLTGTGAEGNADFGGAVALSADSSTLIVGAIELRTTNKLGGAWIFVRQGGAWVQQAILVGSSTAALSNQGCSVAISADGNTVLIGGSTDGDTLGAAWVFTRSGTVWTEQAKLVSANTTAKAMQGQNVALSYDGNTALIGAPKDNDSIGCAIVFVRSGSNWSQQAKLVGPGSIGKCAQGKYVSLSANGNTAVILGPEDNSWLGAVWTYTRSGSTWTQLGSKLALPALYSPYFWNGFSLSGNGQKLAIGDPYIGQYGGVDLYNLSGSTWQLQQSITSTNYISLSAGSLGMYASLSYDGKTLGFTGPRAYSSGYNYGAAYIFEDSSGTMVQKYFSIVLQGSTGPGYIQPVSVCGGGSFIAFGAPRADEPNGGVVVYHKSANTWSGMGVLQGRGDSGSPLMGSSVTISAAGDKIVVGAPKDNGGRGAFWTFTKNGNNWQPQGGRTTVAFTGTSSGFGESVSLSADGKTLATQGYRGWVFFPAKVGFWVFKDSAQSWVIEAGPLHADSGLSTNFGGGGASVSADGNTAFFANAGDDADTGTIYPYVRSGNQWVQQGNPLQGHPKGKEQGYITSLSADGNVGVWCLGTDTFAYVFRRTNGVWQQEARLSMFSPNTPYVVYASAAISGDGNTIALGNQADSSTGAVFVYYYSNGQWGLQAKLRAAGQPINQRFGQSLSFSADGNTLAVGNGIYVLDWGGGVWIYKRNGTTWSQFTSKLLPNDAIGQTHFGVSVALSANGNTLAVGGDYDDYYKGAVWVFQFNGLQVSTSSITNATCNNTSDGKILVQVTGGNAPYTFNWSNGSTSADSLVNLSAGAYYLTVHDTNGDSTTALFNVGVSGSLQTNATHNAICSSSSAAFVAVQPSGGTWPYQYAWSVPQQTDSVVSGLSAGTYFYTVTDAGGCAVSGNVTIPYTAFWSSAYGYEEQCALNNGFATAYAHGGTPPYTYLWSTTPAQTTANATQLSAGLYNFSITDAEGCITTGNILITNNCGNTVQGTVYIDANNNCQFDNGEAVAEGFSIMGASTAGYGYATSNTQGVYSLNLPQANTAQISLFNNDLGCSITSNCTVQNVPVNFGSAPDTVTNINFGLQAPIKYNLQIFGWTSPGIPGGSLTSTGTYSNMVPGSFSGPATITLVHDAGIVLQTTSPVYDSYNAATRTITWQIPASTPSLWNSNVSVVAHFSIPLSTQIGTMLNNYWHIEPTQNDCDTSNNTSNAFRFISGSFDPNFKECAPDSFITVNDSVLTYTVHFQNTGNDTTHFITIRDTLSALVDPASVMDLGASHQPYTFNLSKNGILTWYFDPIFLPDSLTDPINSQGFVRYSVKIKDGLPNGTMVTNRASIYFDYNEPVVTNTAVNVVDKSVGIINITSCVNVKVYPNPLNDYCLFTVNGFEGNYTLELFDITARKVFEQQQIGTNLYRFNRKALAAGTYIYKITDINGNSAVGKVSME
ncbi:MAG: T9SS type A sorting domain-containing protein [Chitinophagales bacterium]